MFCTKCGKEAADDSKFCSGCGASMERPVTSKPVENPAQPQPKDTRPIYKKTWFLAVVASMVVIGFFAAVLMMISGGESGKNVAISAKDYDTRLDNMSSKLDARELSDISTMILGCKVKDFDDIKGWYQDTDIVKKPCYKKSIVLEGRMVTTTLNLNDEYVESVEYKYDDAEFDDYIGYILFNADSSKVTIDSIITEKQIPDLLSDIAANGGQQTLRFSWNYKAKNGIESDVRYNYTFHNDKKIGFKLYRASLTYSLPLGQ